jgi:arylsulfatase A-like enzyme
VLLIVLDTVRADRIGAYGYKRATTPVLDAFARDHATVYEEVRSTSSWTLPSHASMLTGLLPAEHGADHPRGPAAEGTFDIAARPAQMLRPDVATLAERLREQGYRTAAIAANDAYLDHRFGLDRGFERYDDRSGSYVGDYRALIQLFGHRMRVGHVVYRDAGVISRLALQWLDSVRGDERPFFLMLNYMDVHEPCIPPAPFDREFGPEQPKDLLRPERPMWPILYDRALRYLDSQLGRVLERLVERGQFERTAIVVTSDHGEAFGEHGYWSHAWELHEELLRVPLLVKPAGRREVPRDSRRLSVADVHDLVLGLAGLREPQPFAEREPMAEWYHGEENDYVREWAARVGRDTKIDLVTWLDGRRKYVVGSDGSVKAFDLPEEAVAVTLSEDERGRARAKAIEWWRANPPRGREAMKPSEEELKRLRALGYVQ